MRNYSSYHKALVEEMNKLADIPNTVFLGQQVASESFYETLEDIPQHKKREMPVAEEMQLGLSIGMSLEGFLPISIYQRMDFLPRACDQLVNHLNLIEEVSRGIFKPKVIIRTTVGTTKPLNVGLQHSKDLTLGFRGLLNNIPIYCLTTPEEVHQYYSLALQIPTSSILVEYQELY